MCMIGKNRFIIVVLFLFFHTALSINAQMGITDGINGFTGNGTGRNLRAADNNAIQELVKQIAYKYSSDFESVKDYLLDDSGDDKLAAQAVVNTYVNYIQNSSEREILSQSPSYQVRRFISEDALGEIFSARRFKMEDMLKSASKAEKAGKIDDALRFYNWSYYLMQSLPNSDTISMDGRILVNWIPIRIEEILSGVSFVQHKADAKNAVLDITYKGAPVTSLDYIYFNGTDWSNIFSAKDGIGVLEFDSFVPGDIQVKCECNYLSEAHIDRDINILVDVLCGPSFQGDMKTIGSDIRESVASVNSQYEIDDTENTDYELLKRSTLVLLSDKEALPFRRRIDKVLSAIESKKYNSVDELFSLDGLDIFNKLISYGDAYVVGDLDSLLFMVSNDEVICRSVPMNFSFNNNNRTFVENVCFVFNSDTLIDNISFGLGRKASKDILYHPSWSEYARKILIEFLENYKTAYALGRIDYLRQIFDDNAVIVVGKVSERPAQSADVEQKYIDNKYVQYYHRSKEEYMEQLERCYKSNEFINIRFAENEIEKAGKGGEVYGISIKQDYYSTNYGDTGYLFVMVDLNDPKQPIIKVRVWMPERDPDFWGLSNF